MTSAVNNKEAAYCYYVYNKMLIPAVAINLDKRKQLYFVCHLSRVSSATCHQNCRYNGSPTFKLMAYERSIGEIQGHRS